MTKDKQIQFLNFIVGDDMDFYEEHIVNLSDEEQKEFLLENLDFMSDYPIDRDRIDLLKDRLYRGVLRKIKKGMRRKENMGMRKCPECGKEISDKAKSCPQCGCDVNSKKLKGQPKLEKESTKVSNKIAFIGVGLILGIVLGIGIGIALATDSTQQPVKQNSNVTTEATGASNEEMNISTEENTNNTSSGIREVSVGEAMEIHHQYGDYTLTIERVRKSDWLQRSDEDDSNNMVVLVEFDLKNKTYEDPYNQNMFIENHIVTVDNNNYVLEVWSSSYEDGVYNRAPVIPGGANGKVVLPYVANKECTNLTFTINDEYKVVAEIAE